jgi:hypothetical protein
VNKILEKERLVGTGPGYLHFLDDGRVVLQRRKLETLIPLNRFKTKHITIGAGAGTATLNASDLQRSGEAGPEYCAKLARVVEHILTLKDDAAADEALEKLSSVIRAARAVRLGNPTPSAVHAKFVKALRQFAEREKRAPTIGELGLELQEFDVFLAPPALTHLCREHGFSWLRRSPGGRGKKVKPPR